MLMMPFDSPRTISY